MTSSFLSSFRPVGQAVSLIVEAGLTAIETPSSSNLNGTLDENQQIELAEQLAEFCSGQVANFAEKKKYSDFYLAHYKLIIDIQNVSNIPPHSAHSQLAETYMRQAVNQRYEQAEDGSGFSSSIVATFANLQQRLVGMDQFGSMGPITDESRKLIHIAYAVCTGVAQNVPSRNLSAAHSFLQDVAMASINSFNISQTLHGTIAYSSFKALLHLKSA